MKNSKINKCAEAAVLVSSEVTGHLPPTRRNHDVMKDEPVVVPTDVADDEKEVEADKASAMRRIISAIDRA